MKRRTLQRHGIDASRVLPRLYQGACPPTGRALHVAGFDALVLCAEEYQPDSCAFPGVAVMHCPLDDHLHPLSRKEWVQIVSAAKFVVASCARGARVLVTCQAGLNRSGIVTAVAVMMLTNCSGKEAVELVQRRRQWALCNSSFEAQLLRLHSASDAQRLLRGGSFDSLSVR
jgi:protein-tyrosine phosphatase